MYSSIYIVLLFITSWFRCDSTLHEDKQSDAQVVPDNQGTENLTDRIVPDYKSEFDSNPDLALTCITAGLNISSLSTIACPAPVSGLLRSMSMSGNVDQTASGAAAAAAGYSCPLVSTFDIQRKHSHGSFTNRSLVVVSSHHVSKSSEQLHVHSHHLSTPVASQRKRRNSTDSDKKMRRHSAAHTYTLSPGVQRQRRLSHDARDDQSDILQSLHSASTRRRSSLSSFIPQTSRNSHSSRDQN